MLLTAFSVVHSIRIYVCDSVDRDVDTTHFQRESCFQSQGYKMHVMVSQLLEQPLLSPIIDAVCCQAPGGNQKVVIFGSKPCMCCRYRFTLAHGPLHQHVLWGGPGYSLFDPEILLWLISDVLCMTACNAPSPNPPRPVYLTFWD